nr:retrovirus-related Pol polyprotein from transposon TNT 1-94 [Tanacetum cinerariifolium]
MATDQRTVIILHASLSEEAISMIVGLTTARDIWAALEAAYNNYSFERVQNLRDQLRQTQKGEKLVAELGHSFKLICDQLSVIGHPVDATDQISWLGQRAMNYLSKHYMGTLHPLLHSQPNLLSKILVLMPRFVVVATIIIEDDTKTLVATIIIKEEEGRPTANFVELKAITQARVQTLHHMRLLLLLWMTHWTVRFMLNVMSQALHLSGSSNNSGPSTELRSQGRLKSFKVTEARIFLIIGFAPYLKKMNHTPHTPTDLPPINPSPTLITSPSPLPHINTQPTPPPPPILTHPMMTRAKSGIFKHSPLHPSLFVSTNPKTYKIAAKDSKWVAVMQSELDALHKNDTWSFVPRHNNRNVVGSKWLYQTKIFSDDVNNSFLHGNLNECMHMEQPPGFIGPKFPDHVCKLNKALYGLKKAPRAWFHRLSTFLTDNGFTCFRADTSLFVFQRDACIMYLLVYVDDLILTGNQPNVLTTFIARLNKEFAIKGLGELNYFLELEVTYTTNGIFLNQSKYAKEILTRSNMIDAKPVPTPLGANASIFSTGDPFPDPTHYYSIVGNLISLSAKKQPTISCSSCEFEYRAMTNTAAEIVWITHLLQEMHALPPGCPTILCDNRSALFLTRNPVSHKRVKHIGLDYHFVRELVASGKLHTIFIPSKLQVAVIFTKSHPFPQSEFFRKLLRLGPPPSRLRGDITTSTF